MNDLRPYAEWVVQEQLPVVLVVGIKLGCVSHALLTAQSIINDGLPLGWVANRINRGWRTMPKPSGAAAAHSRRCWVKFPICHARSSASWHTTSIFPRCCKPALGAQRRQQPGAISRPSPYTVWVSRLRSRAFASRRFSPPPRQSQRGLHHQKRAAGSANRSTAR